MRLLFSAFVFPLYHPIGNEYLNHFVRRLTRPSYKGQCHYGVDEQFIYAISIFGTLTVFRFLFGTLTFILFSFKLVIFL